MGDFERALDFVLRMEGGYVNDPDDRGGATNMGVTQDTYNAWRASQDLPFVDVADITGEEVAEIYRDRYWNAVGADKLAWPMSLVMFDMAVNHGNIGAKKILQEALQVAPDGIVGPVTAARMHMARPDSLADEVLWSRAEKYRRISANGNQDKFLRGWMWRIAAIRKEAGLLGQVEPAVAQD